MKDKGQSNAAFPPVMLRVALQVGLFTLIIIFVSLILGLFLDKQFDTEPLFLILLLVASMPLSWVGVFKIVNRAKKKLMAAASQAEAASTQIREEANRDEE
ncbi:MAG TPA: AtpZ/AtpI family protein [Anaerolineales bacterium]|nr:AtpZ/AtpI family protein [Anaerolineales bacterium]